MYKHWLLNDYGPVYIHWSRFVCRFSALYSKTNENKITFTHVCNPVVPCGAKHSNRSSRLSLWPSARGSSGSYGTAKAGSLRTCLRCLHLERERHHWRTSNTCCIAKAGRLTPKRPHDRTGTGPLQRQSHLRAASSRGSPLPLWLLLLHLTCRRRRCRCGSWLLSGVGWGTAADNNNQHESSNFPKVEPTPVRIL